MIVRLLCAIVMCLGALPGLAEDINFSDLQRPGSGLSRSAIVTGLASEGANFIGRFSEVDSRRVEDLRHSQSAAITSSSSASTASSQKSDSPSKTFICRIYCNSGSGPQITREFSGPNREAVARMIDENSHNICRDSGFSRSSSIRFDASQCREK